MNYDGSEVPNSLTLVLGNSAPPTCAPEQTKLIPVGDFAQLDAQPTNVPLVDFEATTVDDHGFNPKQASAIEPAKNLYALPPCEYEIQFGTGRKPKCDENGSYYPIQCEMPQYRARVTTCWCVDVDSGEARPNSRRTVSVNTINGALPDYGEPNLDHGQDCRASGPNRPRNTYTVPKSVYTGTAGNPYLYKQNVGPTVRQDPTIKSEPEPINQTPFINPFESPVIYNPSSAKSEYVQPPATPSKTYNPFFNPPATLSNTYIEKTEPMYRPNPHVSHPNANYGFFGNLFGRWGK